MGEAILDSGKMTLVDSC